MINNSIGKKNKKKTTLIIFLFREIQKIAVVKKKVIKKENT